MINGVLFATDFNLLRKVHFFHIWLPADSLELYAEDNIFKHFHVLFLHNTPRNPAYAARTFVPRYLYY